GERQLPNIADHHAMTLVEYARASLRLAPASGILANAASRVDRLSSVIDHMRPRVSRRQTQAARKAMLETRLQRVVDGVSVRRDHADAGILRIRPPRLNIARTGIGLIEVVQARIHVRALGAHPAHLDHIVSRQLARK